MRNALTSFALVLLAGLGTVAGQQARATARLLSRASVPPVDLSRFGRPALPDDQIVAALQRGLAFRDRPSVGSGLVALGNDEFLGLTDRGPNDDSAAVVGHDEGVLFPLPSFVPSIVRFRWREGTSPTLSAVIPLRRRDGRPVSGLPGEPREGVGYDRPRASAPLPPDPGGLDLESVRALPDGRLLLADEYGPSLVVASADGEVLRRYLPSSVGRTDAGYPAAGVIPAVYAERRMNRGFESLAVSPDGRRAWTILESPLGARVDPRFGNSRTLRILEWDVADPLRARPAAEYVMRMSLATAYPGAKGQHDLKVSDAVWMAAGRFVLVERAPGGVRLVMADLRRATNVLGRPQARTTALDAADAPWTEWGVVPAATTVLLDSADVPFLGAAKIEGLDRLGDRDLVLASDNDFGMGDNLTGAPGEFWHLRFDRLISR